MPVPPAPQGLHGTAEHQAESVWTQAPPKPLEQIIPQELFNAQLHAATKPQIEDLPEYLHVEGMPEVEGHAEPQTHIAVEEALPTPPNPSSANQHLFQFQTTPQPEIIEEIKKEPTFSILPYFDTQQMAIQPASQSIQPAALNTMVEFYAGISYDKAAAHSYKCHFNFFYFTPHPLSCQKFIICSNKVAYEYQCGEGVYFDYLSATCALPKTAACFKDNHDLEYETDHIDIDEERPNSYYHTMDQSFDASKLPEDSEEDAGAEAEFGGNENQGWGDWVPPGLEHEAAQYGNDMNNYLNYMALAEKQPEKPASPEWDDNSDVFQYMKPAGKPIGTPMTQQFPSRPLQPFQPEEEPQDGYYNSGYYTGNAGFMSISEHIVENTQHELEEVHESQTDSAEIFASFTTEEPQPETEEVFALPGKFRWSWKIRNAF